MMANGNSCLPDMIRNAVNDTRRQEMERAKK